MKKTFSLAAIFAAGLFMAQPEAKAQGAYFKLGAAYNFGMGSEISYNQTSVQTFNMNGSSYSENLEKVNINYGKGITAGGTVGYMFNPHVGAELGVGYLLGGKNKISNTHNSNGFQEVYEIEAQSRMLLLQPSLVISAGMEGINPYARFGVVAASGAITETQVMSDATDKFEREAKVNGGWGFGFQGGIGAEFKLSDNLGFFSELTMSNLSYSPEKGELTKANFNGKDVLGEFTTREKEVEFVEKYSFSSNDQPRDSEPDKMPKFNMPFSSVGIGVGIKMNF